jgi:hypothetical protein
LNDVKSVLGKQGSTSKPPSAATERDLSNVECNYCHKKGHYKSNCPTLAAKAAGTTPTAAALPASGKAKHWSRVPPADSDPHTKTVTTDGKSAVFKWCKHCRRWRSGPKAHLTEQHRKKTAGAATIQSGNTLQDASGGVNFGLFAGKTNPPDASFYPDFVLDYFAAHHVDPTPATEGAIPSDEAILKFYQAFKDESDELDNAAVFDRPPPTAPLSTGGAPSTWNFSSFPRSLAARFRSTKARCISSSDNDAPPSNADNDPKATAGQW